MENRTVVSRLIPWPSLVSKGTRTGNQWGLRKKKKRNRKKGSVSALRTLNFRGESRRRPTVIPEGYAILLAPFAVSFYPLTVAFFLSNNPRVLSFRRCAAAAAAMFRFYLVCSIYRLIFFFFFCARGITLHGAAEMFLRDLSSPWFDGKLVPLPVFLGYGMEAEAALYSYTAASYQLVERALIDLQHA